MASTSDLVNLRMVNYCFTNKKIPSSIPIPSRRVELPSEEMEAWDFGGGMARDFSRFEMIFFVRVPRKKKDVLSEDVFLQGKTSMSWFSGKAYRDQLCWMERTPEVSSQISMEVPSFIFAFH